MQIRPMTTRIGHLLLSFFLIEFNFEIHAIEEYK